VTSNPVLAHDENSPGPALLSASSSNKDLLVLIHVIRGHRVMQDSDLASLYGVETKAGAQSGSRAKPARFPADFMFQLTAEEGRDLRYQSGTSTAAAGRGGRRYRPYVFTEQGVAMLSSVLRRHRQA